ncbi:unnamed protein product (plasmid) [Mycetohabitans rhizoxinica HKI 454]|uniref:Uncharacterized protein n=1 Tax=Mycetohabitans rhizoxinica (strain DSM 19002 / CIP 109453 / HKI 454) TaxID=882378 RepID=E5ATN2_MYCRK|nr:unnamed protein product [Mycetohabitans rhizoxinica HKI 454]
MPLRADSRLMKPGATPWGVFSLALMVSMVTVRELADFRGAIQRFMCGRAHC